MATAAAICLAFSTALPALASKSTLQYAYEADVEALNAHAALQPANRLRLVDHRDAHGNVVGIDLVVSYAKTTILTVR